MRRTRYRHKFVGAKTFNYIPLVWAIWYGLAFNENQKWKEKIYKMGNSDGRILIPQPDPGAKRKKNK